MSSASKNKAPIDTFYTQLIRYTFYAIFFFTPLILWTKTSEVFEFNKMLFVYLSTIVITVSWIIDSVGKRRFTLVRSRLDLPLMLFFASQVISTVLSIDPHTSLWGYYSRFHGGLVSTICYIVLFYAFITHFIGNTKAILNLIYTTLTSALLVAIYGILEHFGIDKSIWVQDVQDRVFSTLGQPNWLSAYLIALLPLPLIGFFKIHNKYLSWFYAACSLFFFITILFTKSRSGIGATAIVLFLTFIYLFFVSRKTSLHLKPVIIAFFGLLLVTFLIGSPWSPNPAQISHTADVGGPMLPELEKYLNKIGLSSQLKPLDESKLSKQARQQYDLVKQGIRVGGSDSMVIRDVVWRGAMELARRYPFFGTGVETFGYTYYWVRPAAHNLLSEWDFLYNKAHNEYLNFLANTGFVGLGTYLLFIGAGLYLIARNIADDEENSSIHMALLLGFISILITDYFGFSVVIIGIFTFLFPAISVALANGTHKKLSFKPPFPVLTATIVILLSLYAVLKIFTSWTADQAYAEGKNLLAAGRPSYLTPALDSLGSAVKSVPNEPLYKSILAEGESQAAFYLNQEIKAMPASTSAETKKEYRAGMEQYMQAALSESQQALDMNPYQTNYWKSRAKVALYLASIDPKYYNEVIKSLLKITELAPTDAKTLYNLGLVYAQIGKSDQAELALKKAIELKPDYQQAKNQLAAVEKAIQATAAGGKK